jgi:hypothetical protein
VDPGQGDRGELQLVAQHGAVGADEVGDEVHPRRGVGRERDLLRLRPDEGRHLRADLLPALHPVVPVHVAAFLELAVEAVDGEAHGRRRQAGGGGVQVDAAAQGREVLADLVPGDRHEDLRYTGLLPVPEWRNWQTRGTQNPESLTGRVGSIPTSGTTTPTDGSTRPDAL